jgi:hypothetical protein
VAAVTAVATGTSDARVLFRDSAEIKALDNTNVLCAKTSVMTGQIGYVVRVFDEALFVRLAGWFS